MDQATLWQQFSALPEESRQRILDLMAVLSKRRRPLGKKVQGDLTEEPFIGIWDHRDDLAD
jgi:hypothetical protein